MHLRQRIGTGLVLLVLGCVLGVFAVAHGKRRKAGGGAAPAKRRCGRRSGRRWRWRRKQSESQCADQAGGPAQMKEEAVNFQLVGFNDLQGRSAYQPTIHQQGNRWIAYVGFHGERPILNPLTGQMEQNGTLVIDVTDPKQPKTLTHIPGDPGPNPAGAGDGAQMVRVCSGATLPRADRNKTYMLRTYGGSAHETWDVTDPAKPVRLAVVVSGLRDTHKNSWECDTGIAYLVSGVPDWRTPRMTQIYDLSDPAHPVFIRNFGLPGQQPGSTGPVPTELHGAVSLGPTVNRVYFGYGTNGNGIIEIVDREKLLNGPKEPTDANLNYPVVARLDLPPDIGSHTAFPGGGRGRGEEPTGQREDDGEQDERRGIEGRRQRGEEQQVRRGAGQEQSGGHPRPRAGALPQSVRRGDEDEGEDRVGEAHGAGRGAEHAHERSGDPAVERRAVGLRPQRRAARRVAGHEADDRRVAVHGGARGEGPEGRPHGRGQQEDGKERPRVHSRDESTASSCRRGWPRPPPAPRARPAWRHAAGTRRTARASGPRGGRSR